MERIPWGPIRSTLTENFSFGDIKKIVGYTGIDMSQLAHLEQKPQGGAYKSQLLSEIDSQVGNMDSNRAGVVASICCEEILRRKPQLIEELERVLSRVGWKFSGTTLLAVETFDISELKDIPEEAHEDILKAASRLRDGDLSGALSASCGALDAVTGSIFQEFDLGDPNRTYFPGKIKSIDRCHRNKTSAGERT